MDLTIEDRLELLAMPGRYGNAIDDRDWDALARIFAEDATFDVRPLQVRMEGLAEIVRFMDTTRAHPMAHLMANVDIEQRDGTVFMRMRVILPVANDDGSAGPLRIRTGCYYDEMVRTPAGWRVKHRMFTRAPREMRPTETDRAARHPLAEQFHADQQLPLSRRPE